MSLLNRNKNTRKFALTVLLTAFSTAVILVIIWLLTKDNAGDTCSTTTTPVFPDTTTPITPYAPYITPIPYDHFLLVNVTTDTVFHIWFKASGDGKLGSIYAQKLDGGSVNLVASTNETAENWFEFRELIFNFHGQLELSWVTTDTLISYIYAFEPEKVQDEGIRPLYISAEAKLPLTESSYHFRPVVGWMNDPTGFSRTVDGRYHLFYEHHPHSPKRYIRYWGHAVSKDLLHWVHQPIFMNPTDKFDQEGGLFTGSAVPLSDGGLRIYYAERHSFEHPMEHQRSVVTKDMYRPMGQSKVAIPNRPSALIDQLTEDFRDPNVVVGPDGNLLMTTSGKFKDGSGGVVMLFKQNKKVAKGGPEGWEFKSILRKDNRWKMEVCECSALISLGAPNSSKTLWALLYSMDHSWDDLGRRDLNTIFVGTFDGEKFTPKFEQLLDFATGSYAFQAFYDSISGESLLIGWLANWFDYEHPQYFPTALTMPRVLKLSPNNDFLMTPPHPSMAKLRNKALGTTDFRAFKPVRIPPTIELYYELNFQTLAQHGPLILVMNQTGKGPEGRMALVVSTEGLELLMGWKNVSQHQYLERSAKPTSIQLFIDIGSVEMFTDHGRWTGTARIPDEGQIESIQLIGSEKVFNSTSAKIWSLKSIQTMMKKFKD